MNEEGVQILCSGLAHCSELRVLHLAHNKLRAGGMARMLAALHPHIEEIDLSCCDIAHASDHECALIKVRCLPIAEALISFR